MAKLEVPIKVQFDEVKLKELVDVAYENIIKNESLIIELVELHYGTGKAQAVSDLLNEDN